MELSRAIDSNQLLVKAMGDRLNENSASFERQIDFITLNKEIEENLDLLEDGEILPTALRSFITLRIISMNEISGAYLYNLDGRLITKWEKTPNKKENFSLPSKVDVSEYDTSGRVSIQINNKHLVYSRAIRSLEHREIISYISLIYDNDQLEKKLKKISADHAIFLGLFDENSGMIACTNPKLEEQMETALTRIDYDKAQEGVFARLDDSNDMLFCSYGVLNEGCYLFCAVEKGKVYEARRLILSIVAIFTMIGCLVVLLINLVAKRSIISPLHSFIMATRNIREGNYDIQLDEPQQNEIGILAESFNEMSEQIDILVNQNLKVDLAFHQMQISALQKQIKPHFLYNTLECINALAELGRVADIRKVTVAFSKLMKTKLKDQQYILVREEMECVEDFLQIYAIIEQNRLRYEILIEEECRDLLIPNMIIQPLVENAVLHGIRENGGTGLCTVSVGLEEDSINISVSDDGKGMPTELLDAIMAYYGRKSQEEQEKLLGIGLKNVIDRLLLIYEEEFQLTIVSDAEWGTVFDISIPSNTPSEQMKGEALV